MPAPTGAGSITARFVRRPILAFVLNALIMIAGAAAFFGVEVRELPDVDRPVITITTDFTGASPETVDREVTTEIEGAAGRVSGVKDLASESRFGRSRVTVEFDDGTDLDVAAADIRDAVARIANALPDDADEPRIVKADADAELVMRIGVTSATRSVHDLTDLVERQVEDRLISVPGVADLQISGARERIFRVDIDPVALSSRGLTLADVRDVLADAAFDAPAGTLSSRNQSLVVRTTAEVASGAAFEALMLAPDTRLGDVAQVTLGPDLGQSAQRANGQTGLGLGIIRQAQSNTLDISTGIRAAVAELDKVLPDDVSIFVTSDDALFIAGAIHEVEITLMIAVALVIGIIFLFLRDWRATLIPALTIPVSLIGTVAAIYLVGFSVNILTLLALVLATGLVVDDAIVVLENIVRRRAEGMGPRAAAVLGTEQVFFAVVATTVTLAAVFVPLSFLPGQTGGLFREFGFTLAISVLLSAVVALTLCPVLAAKFLTAAPVKGAHIGLVASLGTWLAEIYRRSLAWALAAPLLVVLGRRAALHHRGGHLRHDPQRSDAARGSLGRAAQRHRAAGGLARLSQLEDARDRSAARTDARHRRGREHVPDRRHGRPGQPRFRRSQPCALGGTPPASRDRRRDQPEARRGDRRARLRLPDQQPRHPRRRPRPAIRGARQRL